MLDARALREGIDVLTASLGVTLPEVTKKRHISRLERTSGAAVDQVFALQQIVTALTSLLIALNSHSISVMCRCGLAKPKMH